jgi:hypothetical protein
MNSAVDGWDVPNVLRLMGLRGPDKRGWIVCPVHDDHSPSCHVTKDNRGWICFSCGGRGGVLDLIVAHHFADNRQKAAEWLESLSNA